jgi:hypothetical protein
MERPKPEFNPPRRLFDSVFAPERGLEMDRTMTRRALIGTTPLALASASLATAQQPPAAGGSSSEVGRPGLWTGFPRQDAKLVAEVVGKSHRDEARVRELVKARPALANAWWDWGFGDWESPLGAASHVGQRGIAEFLLERGARIDIFAAAMLGMIGVVKAFVAAQPGVQRTLGPHGITLLAHAKAGGKQAEDTAAYLTELGDADVGVKVAPLPAERKAAVLGKYASRETGVRLECRVNQSGRLMIDVQQEKAGMASQLLHYLGNDEFFPSGVPSVRFRFAIENGKATAVSLHSTGPILTATRTGM